jgi:hypothetical protein
MPLLKLRGVGSTRRRSQQHANGFYDDDEDELEVVSGRKGHSVDNATYVSVSEGVFKRVDIGSEDGSTGSKVKKVTIVRPPVRRTDGEPHPNPDGSYVASLMNWLALDDDKQPEADKDTTTARMYHGVEPYAELKPVKTIKPPNGKLERPSSPLPSTMRQPSRPRPKLSPDPLGRASSPRRAVSPPPRPLSPTRRYEPQQRPVSPSPRLQSDSPRDTPKTLSKSPASASPMNPSSSSRSTSSRPPSIDLTSKRTRKPRVKQSPIVPVQSNRVRSSHRPFDHPSKSTAVFNRSIAGRKVRTSCTHVLLVVELPRVKALTRVCLQLPPMTTLATPPGRVSEASPHIQEASSTTAGKQETQKADALSPQEAVLASEAAHTTQELVAGAVGASHDAQDQQNAIETIEAIERESSRNMLCFCQPDDTQNECETGVAEMGESSIRKRESEPTVTDSPVRPRQSFLTNFLNCPSLCLSDLGNREEHRDDLRNKEDEINRVPVFTLLKKNGGDSSTASSVSLARTGTSTSTNTTGSLDGDASTSSDDGSSCDSGYSTDLSGGKKKAYKLTVTFEPPTWLT